MLVNFFRFVSGAGQVFLTVSEVSKSALCYNFICTVHCLCLSMLSCIVFTKTLQFSMFFKLSRIIKWCCTECFCNPFRSCSGSNDVPKWFSAYYLCASWICSTGMSLHLILILFPLMQTRRVEP